VSKPTLIIDGDIIAYKAAASVERETKWDDDLWTLHASEGEGIQSMETQIERIVTRLNGGECIFALSDGASFRYDVYPLYKSNRKATRKPIILAALKQHLLQNYRTYLRPRLEGDDILGILMTSAVIVPGEKIQVSIDKDQKTIPGLFYDQKKDQLLTITPKQADEWHAIQTLAGDTTDGYPGCPGIGMDRARAAVEAMTELVPYEHVLASGKRKGEVEVRYREEPTDNLWRVIASRFEAAGLTEQDALVQARVARILRASDYDFEKKEPRLWNPITSSACASPAMSSASGATARSTAAPSRAR
jgi:DNA polymerase-1